MKEIKVKLTFLEGSLGTSSANPEIHKEFIASKSADAEAAKEELEALPADELMDKAMTVFPRAEDGSPFVWDYQLKGFIKEAFSVMVEFNKRTIKGKSAMSKWTYKRIVDNFIFVGPRKIGLSMPEGGEITLCQRPLRAETMKGDRVALATSEEVPAGTTMEFSITCLNPDLMKLVIEALDYGKLKGFSQWRNSGKGRFEWEEIK